MKKSVIAFLRVALSILAAVALNSCATPAVPDYLASDFSSAEVNHIAVLPTVDHRVDKSKKLNLDKWVSPTVKRSLKRKGYEYTLHEDRSLVASVQPSDLAAPTPAWIVNLPAEGDRWVMMLVLNDSSSRLTFGSTGNAEMRAFLFDRQKKSVAWREQEIGRYGQGGLVGMAMKGMMERSAIEIAAGSVINSLPAKK